MREAFAMQKLLTFFNKKYWHIWEIDFWKFNETLTNDVVSFEQPGPELLPMIVYPFTFINNTNRYSSWTEEIQHVRKNMDMEKWEKQRHGNKKNNKNTNTYMHETS